MVQLVSLVLKGGLSPDCGAASLISVEASLVPRPVEGGSGSRRWCSLSVCVHSEWSHNCNDNQASLNPMFLLLCAGVK